MLHLLQKVLFFSLPQTHGLHKRKFKQNFVFPVSPSSRRFAENPFRIFPFFSGFSVGFLLLFSKV